MKRPALAIAFGALMIAAGAVHFVQPTIYTPFFPEPLPARAIVFASGAVEIAVGVMAILPRTRPLGTSAILLLMLAFLPLHIGDLFRQHPVIGSTTAAFVRLPLQFVLIAWAWAITEPALFGRASARGA